MSNHKEIHPTPSKKLAARRSMQPPESTNTPLDSEALYDATNIAIRFKWYVIVTPVNGSPHILKKRCFKDAQAAQYALETCADSAGCCCPDGRFVARQRAQPS